MEGKTTDGKLLAQDDIDALLGEAGIEGSYDEPKKNEVSLPAKKNSTVMLPKNSNIDLRDTMEMLYARAVLERKSDVTVIWNAAGTIPMLTGYNMKIHGTGYVSLGTLREAHLVVKNIP